MNKGSSVYFINKGVRRLAILLENTNNEYVHIGYLNNSGVWKIKKVRSKLLTPLIYTNRPRMKLLPIFFLFIIIYIIFDEIIANYYYYKRVIIFIIIYFFY